MTFFSPPPSLPLPTHFYIYFFSCCNTHIIEKVKPFFFFLCALYLCHHGKWLQQFQSRLWERWPKQVFCYINTEADAHALHPPHPHPSTHPIHPPPPSSHLPKSSRCKATHTCALFTYSHKQCFSFLSFVCLGVRWGPDSSEAWPTV